MAVYFVKTTGDNTKDGLSWANAWQTIDRALPDWDGAGTKVVQGDTINVASGDYGELDDPYEEDTNDTGRTDWITYIGDSDDKPVLHNVWFKNTGYAYLKFQYFYFKEPDSGGLYEHAVEISGASFASKRTSYLYFDNCIFESDNTSFKNSQNLYMNYCDYIWFYDCEIIGGWIGIKGSAHYTNITFSGGSIHDQWSDMFDPWSDEPGEIASDVLIEDMTFYNLIPIEGVTGADDHMDFIQSGGGGLMHGNINNFTVRRCKFHFSYDPNGWKSGGYNGLMFQHSGNNFTFENNLTYGMSSNAGFNINGTIVGLNIINNTLAHSSDNPTWAASIDSSCTTVKNYNNIYHILFKMEPGDAEVSQDNNIYYDYDDNSGATIGANSSELGTLALVEALFTSYDDNIFTLPSDSIAVDFGNASEAPAVDILGKNRDASPDAGCYEYIEEQEIEMDLEAKDIANLALYRIGADKITALTDDNERARACNEFYTHARDEVLVMTKKGWNCAKRRVQLTAEGTEPTFDYDYQYRLPEDCLRVLHPSDEGGSNVRVDWERRGDYLLLNDDECYLVYIYQLTDVTKMSPLLVKAISLQLASCICTRIKQSSSLKQDVDKDLLVTIMLSEGIEASEKYAASPNSPRKTNKVIWIDVK